MTARHREKITSEHRKEPEKNNCAPRDNYGDDWDRKSGDDIVNEAIHALHEQIEQIVRPDKKSKEVEKT